MRGFRASGGDPFMRQTIRQAAFALQSFIGRDIPLPPVEYMKLVCGPEHDEKTFRRVGKSLVDDMSSQGMIGSNVRLLDIGCGCGRVARCLLDKPLKSYVGFDRHAGMIEWCNQEIAPRDPRFTFLYCQVKSPYTTMDGDQGTIDVADFRFPFEDRSFDAILLASVFTHMPLGEISHYLKEIRRVLDRGGRALFSVFLSDQPSDNGVDFVHVRSEFAKLTDSSQLDYKFLYEGGGHHWHLATRTD
jgi:SAM-dependent methyltransferase